MNEVFYDFTVIGGEGLLPEYYFLNMLYYYYIIFKRHFIILYLKCTTDINYILHN